MAVPFTFSETIDVVELLTPAADAGGRSGDIISLRDCHKACIVVHLDQGNAATVALTPLQHADVAGDGKALSANCRITANQDCAATSVSTLQTAAKNFTTSAAVKHKIVKFEIDPADLDQANEYDCLSVTTGASNAANITSAKLLLYRRRQEATPVNVIVD